MTHSFTAFDPPDVMVVKILQDRSNTGVTTELEPYLDGLGGADSVKAFLEIDLGPCNTRGRVVGI